MKVGIYDRQLLKDERWKYKAQFIKSRDLWTCQKCGDEDRRKLRVHHTYYKPPVNNIPAAPWDYPDEALITLCDKCHKEVHGIYEKGTLPDLAYPITVSKKDLILKDMTGEEIIVKDGVTQFIPGHMYYVEIKI